MLNLNRIKEEDKSLELKYVGNLAAFNGFTRLIMMTIGDTIFCHCHYDERCRSIGGENVNSISRVRYILQFLNLLVDQSNCEFK